MGIEPTRALPLVSFAIMRVWQLMGPNNECGIIDVSAQGTTCIQPAGPRGETGVISRR